LGDDGQGLIMKIIT